MTLQALRDGTAGRGGGRPRETAPGKGGRRGNDAPVESTDVLAEALCRGGGQEVWGRVGSREGLKQKRPTRALMMVHIGHCLCT